MNAAGPLDHLIAKKHAESKDRETTCCVCSKPAVIDGYLVGVLRTWNDRATRKEDFISPFDVEIPCSLACAGVLLARKRVESEKENETTDTFLRMLFAGSHTIESRAWLRSHGKAKHVDRVMAREGTTNVPG